VIALIGDNEFNKCAMILNYSPGYPPFDVPDPVSMHILPGLYILATLYNQERIG
jgi:hypothetical protein